MFLKTNLFVMHRCLFTVLFILVSVYDLLCFIGKGCGIRCIRDHANKTCYWVSKLYSHGSDDQ